MLVVMLSTGVAQAGKSTGGGNSGNSGSFGRDGYVDRVTYQQDGHEYTETYGVTPGGTAWSQDTCNNCGNHGGGTTNTGGCTTTTNAFGAKVNNCNPAPPPVACKITVDTPVIGLGTSKITISWLPSPATNVSLKRVETIPVIAQGVSHNVIQQASVILAGGGGSSAPTATPPKVTTTTLITPPSGAQSFADTVTETSPGTINYNVAFTSTGKLALRTVRNANQQASIILAGGGGPTPPPPPPPPISYACSVTVKIVKTLTECNDGIDNADPEDSLIDQQDPACHTDGNTTNPLSYDPLRTTETNPAIDLVAHISAPLKINTESAVLATPSEQNTGTLPATTNTLVSGWRNLTPGNTPSCGPSGSLCFTVNGNSYIRMSSYAAAYTPQQTKSDTPFTFTPQTPGMYEVCAVADYYNVISEGIAGEANNTACQPIQVYPSNIVIPPITATSPLLLTTSPTRVKRGGTATLVWDTGSRTQCTITGTNGQILYLAGTSGASGAPTTPITTETKYTLTCIDDNSSVSTMVKLLPQYKEI